jgi:nucleoside triphosphatase
VRENTHQEFIFDETFHEKRRFLFIDFICRTDADADDVVLNDEAQEYVWVSMEEALALPIDPYTRHLIEKAISRTRGRTI